MRFINPSLLGLALLVSACGGGNDNGTTSTSNTGGSTNAAGSSATGGKTSAGANGSGGTGQVGGTSAQGGSATTGGTATAGAGGVSTGGASSTTVGGTTATGTGNTGGSQAAGASSTGGSSTQGGSSAGASSATGGSNPTGGTSSVVGASATGGSSATGGESATGGSTSTGGTGQTGGVSSSTGGGFAGGGNAATGGITGNGGLSTTGGSTTTGGGTSTCTSGIVGSDGKCWTCDAAAYGDNICDCGCGSHDPACDSSPSCSDGTSSDCCQKYLAPGSCVWTEGNRWPYSAIRSNDNTGCLTGTPVGWTCPESTYGNGSCDCGCGVDDIDCAGGKPCENDCSALGSCSFLDGCSVIDSGAPSQCTEKVAGWTCPLANYADGSTCDCGCGAPDPDCNNKSACERCDVGSCADPALGCAAIASDWSKCTSGWTCDFEFYGDGYCDCGCGIVDIDCVTPNVDLCTSCGVPGSCATNCSALVPNNSALCK